MDDAQAGVASMGGLGWPEKNAYPLRFVLGTF